MEKQWVYQWQRVEMTEEQWIAVVADSGGARRCRIWIEEKRKGEKTPTAANWLFAVETMRDEGKKRGKKGKKEKKMSHRMETRKKN